MAPKKGVSVKRQKAVARAKPKREQDKSGPGTYINEANFVKLVLDPCNGPLTKSPFGSRENSYVWRLNSRTTVVVGANGNFMAALYPKGVYNTSASTTFPSTMQVWTNPSLTGVNEVADQVREFPGTATVAGIAAQLKITAGCVKATYTGVANNASGQLFGWEGQGDTVIAQYSGSNAMMHTQSLTAASLNGMTYPITAGVESRLDYSKANPQQNYFSASTQVPVSDVYCPIAMVGGYSLPVGQSILVEYTLIVEWTPLMTSGIPPQTIELARPGVELRVANALRGVGAMLVSAGPMMLGGYAGMVGKVLQGGARVARSLLQ
jgi:hypothetical protein